jgi:nucleoside-diphosphate-sugar epimerase
MTGRRALIGGGTGLLGRRIVAALARRGVEAIALSRIQPSVDIAWRGGDLSTGDGLVAACAGMDVVIHSASLPPTERAGVRATANLIDVARRAQVPHLVFVGIRGIDGVGWFP